MYRGCFWNHVLWLCHFLGRRFWRDDSRGTRVNVVSFGRLSRLWFCCVRFCCVVYGRVTYAVFWMSAGCPLDIHWTRRGRLGTRRGFRRPGVSFPLGVRTTAVDQASGVLVPVVDSPVIIHKTGALQPVQKDDRLTLPVTRHRNVQLIELAEVAVLRVVQRPPPEEVQMPHSGHARHVQQARQLQRLRVIGEGLM